MLKNRGSRSDRQASARSQGGFSWSKLLVAAAIVIAVCIIFLNSNRILNVDLHGGSRVRLRVKQGLPFGDPLPESVRDGGNPWYASAEDPAAEGLPGSRADPSAVNPLRGTRGTFRMEPPGGAVVEKQNEGREAERKPEGTPLEAALERDRLMAKDAAAQQRMLERMSSDASGFRATEGSSAAVQQATERVREQDAEIVDAENGGSGNTREQSKDEGSSSEEERPSTGVAEAGEQASRAEANADGVGLQEEHRSEVAETQEEQPSQEGGNAGEEEDTYMVKMYKEVEQKSKLPVKDPALEAGSRIVELDPSDPDVQRIISLVRQLDPPPSTEGREEEQHAQERERHLRARDVGKYDQMQLVGLYHDGGEGEPSENPKLASWREDLWNHQVKLEEAKKEHRAKMQKEQEEFYPAIPVLTGVLEDPKASVGIDKEEESRPARVDDLLEGQELEQRLREEGTLDDILADPELIPDWNTQFAAQQIAAAS